MSEAGLKSTGAPSLEELRANPGYPTPEEYSKGPTVFIECIEGIPCNPCEDACPKKAISVGSPITNLPQVDRAKCVACSLCISACPGLAIHIKDYTYSESEASISFPYEYCPLPEKGARVALLDRMGEYVCDGTVLRVLNPPANRSTAVVIVAYDKARFLDVVTMRRLERE